MATFSKDNNNSDDIEDIVNKVDEESIILEEYSLSNNVKKAIDKLRTMGDMPFEKGEISDEYNRYLKKYDNRDSKGIYRKTMNKCNTHDKQMMEFSQAWNEENIEEYDSIQNFRQSLPIFSQKEEILNAIEQHQLIIIDGDAGCGKSTQIPQYILDSYIESGQGSLCRIACLQTKKISAVSLAKRVMYERSQDLRPIKEINYQIRLERHMGRIFGRRESILYCTTGILLAELRRNPNLNNYSHIIIDDVQTHSEIADFLLIHLKEILIKDKNLKVIVMGARIKAEVFKNYFDFLEQCPVIKILGKTFSVETFYLEDMIQATGYIKQKIQLKEKRVKSSSKTLEYNEKKKIYLKSISKKYDVRTITALSKWDENQLDLALIVRLLKYLTKSSEPKINLTIKSPKRAKKRQKCQEINMSSKIKGGSILIFLPGWQEIDTLYKLIKNEGRKTANLFLITLHSKTAIYAREKIFEEAPAGKQKVILATNIAETSITIEDCTVVIDCGKLNMMSYNPSKDLNVLKPRWISKSSMHQRQGRAGRTKKGICYHMFTKLQKQFLKEYPVPEMRHCNLESSILNTKLLTKISASEHLAKAIYPPKKKTIQSFVDALQKKDVLSENEKLTPLGFLLAQLPTDICIGKLLLYGAMFSCLNPILSIAAYSSFPTPLIPPTNASEEFEFYEMLFKVAKNSQCDKLLHIFALKKCEDYSDYKADESDMQFFSRRTLTLLMGLKYQFCRHLYRLNILNDVNPESEVFNKNSSNETLIKAIICAAFYPNVAKVDPERSHDKEVIPIRKILKVMIMNDVSARVSPMSVNAFVSNIRTGWLTFQSKLLSTKLYIYETTSVNVASIILFSKKLQVHGKIKKGKKMKGNEKCVLLIDEFLGLKSSTADIQLILELKHHFENLMFNLISNPKVIDWSEEAKDPGISILRCVVDFVS